MKHICIMYTTYYRTNHYKQKKCCFNCQEITAPDCVALFVKKAARDSLHLYQTLIPDEDPVYMLMGWGFSGKLLDMVQLVVLQASW